MISIKMVKYRNALVGAFPPLPPPNSGQGLRFGVMGTDSIAFPCITTEDPDMLNSPDYL
jgi:hypothetical protein